jgi:hypothetical protein
MKKRLTQKIAVAVLALALILPALSTTQARSYNVTPLSAEETASLTLMREEEKLARDVYTFFYETYRTRIFSNIAASEQKHMGAIEILLDRYGLPDPADNRIPGEFQNEELRALYLELTAQGGQSMVEALKVGVIIEEKDIADLQAGLAVAEHADIKTVYLNLLSASGSHLKAFISALSKLGVYYEP